MEIKRLVVGNLDTNCYLLISNNDIGIIDPGDEAGRILNKIQKIGKEPRYIINTHYHFDHTLANKDLKSKTGAKILIHEAERNFINFTADRFLKDGDEIKIGNDVLEVLRTSGHTRGSICLFGENFVFSGDTLFKDGCGRTDLPGGSQEDIEASLDKLSKILKPGITVYPGHGESFKI